MATTTTATGPTSHVTGPTKGHTTGHTTGHGMGTNKDAMKGSHANAGNGHGAGFHETSGGGATYGKGMKTVYQTPGEFTPEIQHITNSMRTLFQARTMEDHNRALNFLDMDVQWDNPFALLRGRDKFRTFWYIVKAFFKFDFAPKVVNVRMLNEKRAEVEIDGITRMYPIKNIWTLGLAPFLWLLPEHFDLQENFTLGIKAETDRVSFMRVRIQNWPALPNIVRYALSFVFGNMATWTEGVWSRTLSWFGDYSYETERPTYGTYGSYGTGPQYGSGYSRGPDLFESAKHAGQNVMQSVEGMGQKMKDTVTGITGYGESGRTGYGTAGGPTEGAGYMHTGSTGGRVTAPTTGGPLSAST